MLDVRRLWVLRAVAEHGSMTAAAETLAFSPSAVSQQIAALERQAGTPLVRRRPRGVVLTDAGRLLVEHADAVRARLERAEADLADLVGVRAGRLRLATFASAGAGLLPEAIGTFRRRHPEVRMTMEIREPHEVAGPLRDGTVDLAVVFDYRPGESLDADGLARTDLVDDPMNVAVPAGHALAGGRGPLGAADLRGEAWIQDPGPTCGRQLLRLCADAGYEPTVAFLSDDFPTINRLVASGVGVALVPDLAADQMGPGVVLRPLRPALDRRIAVLTAPEPSPATRAMVGILAAAPARTPVPTPIPAPTPMTEETG